jgi:hypothetical protein
LSCPSGLGTWVADVKVEIARIGDPQNVLPEIEKLESDYRRTTKNFPVGSVLEDAEEIVGPIDVPPLDDNRLKTTIAEIRSLIDQTLAATPG